MMTRSICVPDYVAEEFEKPLRHPNPAPDAVDRSLKRVYRLVSDALSGILNPEWEVNDGEYASSPLRNEPYGLHRATDKFVIYAAERGRRSPLAVFKDDHLAAKYFVWLVSKGERSIDWTLHMEMEP